MSPILINLYKPNLAYFKVFRVTFEFDKGFITTYEKVRSNVYKVWLLKRDYHIKLI
jgi:hypothetical protein